MKHMKNRIYILCLALLAFALPVKGEGTVIRFTPDDQGDLTLLLRERIEAAGTEDVHIIFEPGRYVFRPDLAVQKYCAVTNHGNGLKNILFHLCGKRSVTIEGNGAELVMHGRMFPFLIEDCDRVRISGLTIDWDIPFLFQGEVVACDPEAGWTDIRPYRKGYSWKLRNGRISFPEIDGFSYTVPGSTLAFDKESGDVYAGARDHYSSAPRVVQRPEGILRIFEKRKYPAQVGSILVSKGDREHDRYAPAFDFKDSKDIVLKEITVHHALGMGFLFERCDGIQLSGLEISVTPSTDRLVSTTADATHFANCKGQILIENCSFQNMLDDGSNVHGAYVVVDRITGPDRLVAELQHFEQLGFKFAAPGDEVWFIHQPSPERQETAVVEKVEVINEKYFQLTFSSPLPEGLKTGDLLENKTWNPDYTMRGCRISHHRARNVVLKTPGRIVIEDNDFSSMMSSILFRGESFFWYESGAVCDAVITGNRFRNCAASSPANAVLLISPRLGKSFSKQGPFDRNIRFIGNFVEGPNPKVVDASRTDALVIRDNEIVLTGDGTGFTETEHFKTEDCTCVLIRDNSLTVK